MNKGRSEEVSHFSARHRSDGSDAEDGLASVDAASDEVWDALRSSVRLQILEALAGKPHTTARELALALGCSVPRVHYHVGVLEKVGLVRAVQSPAAPGGGPPLHRFRLLESDLFMRVSRQGGPACDKLRMLIADVAADALREVAATSRSGKALDTRPRRMACGHEALTAEEITKVQELVDGIDSILRNARSRRRASGGLPSASTFVTLCVWPASSQRLADGCPSWSHAGT